MCARCDGPGPARTTGPEPPRTFYAGTFATEAGCAAGVLRDVYRVAGRRHGMRWQVFINKGTVATAGDESTFEYTQVGSRSGLRNITWVPRRTGVRLRSAAGLCGG